MTLRDKLFADPWFPFEGDLTVGALQPPVVLEPLPSPQVDAALAVIAASMAEGS